MARYMPAGEDMYTHGLENNTWSLQQNKKHSQTTTQSHSTQKSQQQKNTSQIHSTIIYKNTTQIDQ